MPHDLRSLEQVLGPSASTFKDQLLITLVKRLAKGTRLEVPATEIDRTGQDLLAIEIDQARGVFVFTLGKKS